MKGRQIAQMLGVVTQFTTLNFDFSVEEMVLMGRSPHKKHLTGTASLILK